MDIYLLINFAGLLVIILLFLYVITLRRDINKFKIVGQSTDQNIASDEKNELNAILYSIHDGVIATDLDANVKLASKKALEILKTDLIFIKDKKITEILPIYDLIGKIVKDYEINVALRSGETITVKIDTLPILDQGGAKGTLYIIQDITKETEFEGMKLDFVAMAAHQLRTPLTTIKGYLYALSQSITSKLTQEEKMFLDRSMYGAEQLASLIENLLNVSRIEAGKLKLQPRFASLEEIAENAVSGFSLNTRSKNIQITVYKPSRPLPKILIDPYLISEVIKNLLTNAIEASHMGGKVEIHLHQQGEALQVDIKDYGKGIPSSAINHIFTKFFKVISHLSQGSEGAGLGLYFSKSIIDAHHGKIWVNSVLGLGATFSFTLPLN